MSTASRRASRYGPVSWWDASRSRSGGRARISPAARRPGSLAGDEILARQRRAAARRDRATRSRPRRPRSTSKSRRGGLEQQSSWSTSRRARRSASSSTQPCSTGCARATTTARSVSSTSCRRACAAASTSKDDDFRLSFLYGNFTTLTRFTEADFERVITEKLSPLYVSIHATDPDVRTASAAQPARRDEPALARAAARRGRRGARPGRRVPGHQRRRGARRHAARRARPLPAAGDARCGAARCERAQPRGGDAAAHDRRGACRRRHRAALAGALRGALGRRLVFASDEYYLLAERPFPPLDAYDDFVQHENGIGMVAKRTFDVPQAASRRSRRGMRVDRRRERTGIVACRVLRRGRRRAGRGLPRTAGCVRCTVTTLRSSCGHGCARRAPVAHRHR